jgi:hypothetical protein
MGFKKGDKVKAKNNISGGLLKANADKGQHGVITGTHWDSTFDVQFMKGGLGTVNVELTRVKESDLEKR